MFIFIAFTAYLRIKVDWITLPQKSVSLADSGYNSIAAIRPSNDPIDNPEIADPEIETPDSKLHNITVGHESTESNLQKCKYKMYGTTGNLKRAARKVIFGHLFEQPPRYFEGYL